MLSRVLSTLPMRTLTVLSTVLVSVLVATAMPASAHDQPPGGTFLDDDGNVHEGFIEVMAEQAITYGCTDAGDLYCPRDTVTRGQMAAFLVRAFSLPASSTDHFRDDDGHLFEGDINALASAGITRGCGDGTGFCPDGAVSRGEMAAFLRRALDLPVSSTDHFRDDDGHLFEGDINAIADRGITKGCNPPDNTAFCPGSSTKRDQMATFISNARGFAPHPPPERTTTEMTAREAIRAWFPDVEDEAVRVAECESSMNPDAVNPAGYHGLFQIGEHYHADAFQRVTGEPFRNGVYSAYYNSQYARYLYEQSGYNWSQWGCKP